MAVYKKPLYDKDGNQIYPDVGLELDEVIYGDDPGQVETPSPWIETGDIKDNQITSAKIDWTTIYPMGLDTGWIEADQYINTTYFAARGHIYYRILSGVVYWAGAIYCHTAPNTQMADLLTDLPSEVAAIDEPTFYGSQFMVQDSDYQIWIESGKLRVYEFKQNIPVTQLHQGYTLTQVKYIPARSA